MIKLLLICLLCMGINGFHIKVYSAPLFNNSSELNLSARKQTWPDWDLPLIYRSQNINNDLIYPTWFTGLWEVQSTDLNDSSSGVVTHKARFSTDSLGRVLADRAFNSQSLGAAIFGDQLLSVKDDPNSPNRQVSFFKGNSYLETTISRRNQSKDDNNFLTDELFLQIFHGPDISRIQQVEVLSSYRVCQDKIDSVDKTNEIFICGDQWEVSYNPLPENLFTKGKANKSHHYSLKFYRLH